MRARTLAAALAVSALGCTPATPPTRPPENRAVVTPPARSVPDAAAPAAEPELPRILSALPADAELYVYVDGDRLRESPLLAVWAAASEQLDAEPTQKVRTICGFDLQKSLSEAALAAQTGDAGRPTFVAVVEIDRGAFAALECLKKLGATSATAGVELGHGLIAVDSGSSLVLGDPELVRLTAERLAKGARARLPERLNELFRAQPNAEIRAVDQIGKQMKEVPFGWASLSASSTPRRFALRIEADAPDAATAQSFAQAFESTASSPFAARGDTPGVRTWTEGNRLLWELSVDGAPKDQAFRLGVASALGVNAVRRYLARSKAMERSVSLAEIALRLGRYAEGRPPGQRRFPPSAPLTPKTVPAGTKATLEANAWSHPTWKAIGFSVPGPVYYSYEIVTARGGRSTVIRAIGDLDGDGVLSKAEIKLTIDAQGNVLTDADTPIENELE